ncbi:Six-hairpin glycosidase [Aspergillus ambiguus]|uniref:glycoside hydrolase family 88 protein n=1 Tax=Aspergillus ambiguus TaxID=176160 RepID=UPI003CCDC951
MDPDVKAETNDRGHFLYHHIPRLFEHNIIAKVFRVAARSMEDPDIFDKTTETLLAFPETVPQEGPSTGRYEFREPEFWTCGFFPGSLYALLERCVKYPQHGAGTEAVYTYFRHLCKIWAMPLHDMADRTDTHDIGFIVMPALKREWELIGNKAALQSILRAARSLATRYVPSAGAIRSWDCLLKKDITVTDTTQNLLVIIDSLCNLDLLFYASAQTGDTTLATMGATHARTLLKTHLRPEASVSIPEHGYQGQLYSTCHVANVDPLSGILKWRWTGQGYDNESTWARGQAWAILGYSQTYMWTKDPVFLDAACGVAEYFLYRLRTAPSCVEVKANVCPGCTSTKGRFVPLWDFDAPVDAINPLRDSSAAVIAANGLLVLFQALLGAEQDGLARRFLNAAFDIVKDTIDLCLSGEGARFVIDGSNIRVEDCMPGKTFDAILKNGTANNNQNARRRYWNHGLVYGDYYLIEFGNKLLDLGLV